ncbi:MAG: class F sortase [bacterium]
MQLKISLKRSLLIVGLVEIALSLLFIFFLTFDPPTRSSYAGSQASQILIGNGTSESIQSIASEEKPSFGFPARLKIPSINTEALIESAGLAPDGAMDVPKDRDNAAWFNLGPRPGENGSAVIAGHYGWKDGKRSVFDNLYKLRKGDKIYIEDDKGVIITFVVRESRRYNPEADASGVFGSNDGKPHLNLITCEGSWDEDSKSYLNRLVVFADKE